VRTRFGQLKHSHHLGLKQHPRPTRLFSGYAGLHARPTCRLARSSLRPSIGRIARSRSRYRDKRASCSARRGSTFRLSECPRIPQPTTEGALRMTEKRGPVTGRGAPRAARERARTAERAVV
jgi:hypothetical protein